MGCYLVTSLFVDIEEIKTFSPEKQLLFAILLRTWADLDSIDKFARNTSFFWLDLTETADWSFPWLCEMLDLNPKQVKKAMLSTPYYEAVQKLAPERYGRIKKTRLCYFE